MVTLLEQVSIHAWLIQHKIKNEKGDPIDFYDHPFLFDIYRDRAQHLCAMKAAQVGLSTLEILKNLWDAKFRKMDIIYTLPTDEDVNVFVGGKVNRIISQNPVLMEYTKDKDSVEQKKIGESMLYFRGTWTKKAAIMVTADRLVHDEKDSSKSDVVKDYQARLQHSKHKQVHTFSHPSTPGTGVDVEWQVSDQKHWFVTCPHCEKKQYLSWDLEDEKKMSVDLERKIFVCRACRGELSDDVRRRGRWIAKKPESKRSGYWVPLLICPYVSAEEIIDKFNDPDQTEEFFYNKILGLPYVGKGNKLTNALLMQNLNDGILTPDADERIVIGVDTGLKIDYVMGGQKGLFFHGEADDYDVLERHMDRWKKAICIIDQGGDLIGPRKFAAKYPGRVFLCLFSEDRKTKELVRWGKKEEQGAVTADRNRMIQLVVDEFSEARIPLQGQESDWYEYWLDWNNLSRKKITDATTNAFKGFKWIRSGRDHKALATVYWRIGMFRFGWGGSKRVVAQNATAQNPIQQNDHGRFNATPYKPFQEKSNDWRD
jgi:hypothetical protein